MIGAGHVSWARGYGAKIDVQDAHAELEDIRRSNDGELTANTVVERARDKRNVLHPQVFDRGQKRAAEEYYKENARRLIRAIVIRFDDGPEDPTRIYQVVRDEESQVSNRRRAKFYSDISEALEDPVYRQYLLEHALNDARRWRKKYEVLEELADVFFALDKVAT